MGWLGIAPWTAIAEHRTWLETLFAKDMGNTNASSSAACLASLLVDSV